MKEFISKHWLSIVTLIILLFAIFVFAISKTMNDAANVGDYLAGFAGSLAFLWLIASFKQQQKALAIQSEELTLQRKAIELQGKELKNLGKFSALEQVRIIVQDAVNQIKMSETHTKDHTDFLTILIDDKLYKSFDFISTSNNISEIAAIYREWLPIETEIRGFFNKIVTASKIYLEQVSEEDVDFSEEALLFIQNNMQQIIKIPYISEVAGTLQSFIPIFIQLHPFLIKMQLAGIAAMSLGMNNNIQKIFDEKMFVELKKELDQYDLDYPAILSLYNKATGD